MILYPSIVDLMNKIDSKYTLCALVSKRARQIISGEPSLVETDSKKPVTIATEEINEGLITFERQKFGLK
ncbi:MULTISPECIES: DNA-directed RNA polymerase subunit omega [Thermoanaerobacterium]|jgi:DNA-directed RNA polymerase subunit omega|uniref:DNA-directed RNA polymerase subunit omega n=1 Tax=Thermoanaerobacterium xylanolyticum (strain ATCC 49914 / DSM 7097 / LX-11) TaxID=858215 RepID=F6BG84_THEXL|nr:MULTISPECIES: DNA-directed RNA polymerase subunit omega [Thermoanaerobacterium]AEF17429.1 DNA-directed RNA polymerase subunit omega [Thermoanaerobacterium xylanolyticum LX-11]MDI3311984.1 DNA-directed RNA polymerase subunit omega [Thermoanaerobacterium sp.]ORX24309.1 DNA-directed RNA polymerase subunit omega [Thermoanaerobacterium sp. PSU-2]HHV73301.1 DNA-directed RNA polymerase subunit omega [Thermoanaerobacterium sp.]